MSKLQTVFSFSVVLAATACITNKPANLAFTEGDSNSVPGIDRASFELGCPKEQLTVTSFGDDDARYALEKSGQTIS